jgi:hypothetical protein
MDPQQLEDLVEAARKYRAAQIKWNDASDWDSEVREQANEALEALAAAAMEVQ